VAVPPHPGRLNRTGQAQERNTIMIIVGVVLMLIAFFSKMAIFWTLGVLVLLIGVVLALAGRGGRQVAGRRHWY
jgi:uncharacterized membrane protein HdeD (DUF308 family)